MKLNRSTVQVEERPIKVVQFGEGNFLRAFIDWMIHEMNEKAAFNAGVAVVQPIPQGLGDLLDSQDGLYHLMLNGIDKGELINKQMLVDCIQKVVNPYQDYQAYLQLAEIETLQFVFSNTTEAGIVARVGDELEKVQESFPAKLTAFLYHRFTFFNGDMEKGLVILPCELINQNGEKLKEIILKYATEWNLEGSFSEWIENACTFYNTLVDRIVPGYPKERITEIHQEIGFEDQLVVEGELFHLFVLEGDEKIKKILPFERAGLNVVVTKDQSPYRERKVRILNGAHTLMVPMGLLSDIFTVREALEDNEIGHYMNVVLTEDILPSLPATEGLEEFKNDVLDRFRNPYIKHYLTSIALNSFSKFNTRVLPSILQYHEKFGRMPKHILVAFAALIKLYDAHNVERLKLSDNQDIKQLLSNVWEEYDSNYCSLDQLVLKILSYTSLWGRDLNELPQLHEGITHYLRVVNQNGVKSLVENELYV